jgi:CheY-like chemotaxis protein
MFEPTLSQDGALNKKDSPAHILIVDDNLINRKKIRLSVRSLGHESTLAENGMVALEKLRSESFDVVLLDLVMPEMDGFDVLKQLKADKQLSHIPVIVVTAYDEQTESVVKAIELGAEDVLPKDFNPVLLNARLDASLNKKRYRDQEIEYFKRVDALTSAAVVIESGRFNTDKLELDKMAAEPDSLGRLAAVFKGMASEIYNRELKLHRSLHILQGSFLVVLVGVVWGLSPALSRMLASAGTNPLGLAVWINLIIATSCFLVAAYRGKLPRLTGREVLFYIGWAVIAGVLQRLVTYWVSGNVEAAMISLIVTLQGFIVFAFAAVTRLEKATPKRLLGLAIGLIGVALVLWSKFDATALTQSAWLLAATLLPLLFAIEAIVLAGKRPQHIDIFASVGLMTGFSVLFLLPMAMVTGNMMSLGPTLGKVELLTLLLGIASTASILLAFRLIAVAGSVFYSQCAYTMTLAGVVWGMLLLDETLPAIAWVAFFFIVIGVYLVEPKPSSDDIIIKRSFTDNGAAARPRPRASDGRTWIRKLTPALIVGATAVCSVFLLNGLAWLYPSQGSGIALVKADATRLPEVVASSLPEKVIETPFINDSGSTAVPRPVVIATANDSVLKPTLTTTSPQPVTDATPITSTTPHTTPGTAPHSSADNIDSTRIVNTVVDRSGLVVNTASAVAVTVPANNTQSTPVDSRPRIAVNTPAATTVPPVVPVVTPDLSREFLFISADDPFAQLTVTAQHSVLMIPTPDSGTVWSELSHGSRLTALAGNGQWFQVRTEENRVGFVRQAAVSIEAMQ